MMVRRLGDGRRSAAENGALLRWETHISLEMESDVTLDGSSVEDAAGRGRRRVRSVRPTGSIGSTGSAVRGTMRGRARGTAMRRTGRTARLVLGAVRGRRRKHVLILAESFGVPLRSHHLVRISVPSLFLFELLQRVKQRPALLHILKRRLVILSNRSDETFNAATLLTHPLFQHDDLFAFPSNDLDVSFLSHRAESAEIVFVLDGHIAMNRLGENVLGVNDPRRGRTVRTTGRVVRRVRMIVVGFVFVMLVVLVFVVLLVLVRILLFVPL